VGYRTFLYYTRTVLISHHYDSIIVEHLAINDINMANQQNAPGNVVANPSIGVVYLPQELIDMGIDNLYAVSHAFSRKKAKICLYIYAN